MNESTKRPFVNYTNYELAKALGAVEKLLLPINKELIRIDAEEAAFLNKNLREMLIAEIAIRNDYKKE